MNGTVECPRCGRATAPSAIWLWIGGQAERLTIENGRIVQAGHVDMFDLACGCKFDTDLWTLSVTSILSLRQGTRVDVMVVAKPAVRREPYAGYVIAGRDGGPELKIDWDGEIHSTERDAGIALLECHRYGYEDYRVFGLVQVEVSDDL